MTLPEIKHISIREYLRSINIHPAKEHGYYGMYHCPFREDRNASMKVDYVQNLWYDFGTNEGGSIIDLVMKMENCSFTSAVQKLDGLHICTQASSDANIFSFHRDCNKQILPAINITGIIPITHPKLIDWINERKIDLKLTNMYCREIHYRNKDKDYFSIGFRNDNGGYELSSPPDFKSCFPPKDITTIRNGSDACLVFEGFWDFLSYLILQKIEKSRHDIAVLNSVANVQKAIDFLKSHKEIYTYLDNDDAGRKATEFIRSANTTVYNHSTKYAGYIDLNDYLCNKQQVQQKKKNRGMKI